MHAQTLLKTCNVQTWRIAEITIFIYDFGKRKILILRSILSLVFKWLVVACAPLTQQDRTLILGGQFHLNQH